MIQLWNISRRNVIWISKSPVYKVYADPFLIFLEKQFLWYNDICFFFNFERILLEKLFWQKDLIPYIKCKTFKQLVFRRADARLTLLYNAVRKIWEEWQKERKNERQKEWMTKSWAFYY